jgi:hypothetical protein
VEDALCAPGEGGRRDAMPENNTLTESAVPTFPQLPYIRQFVVGRDAFA